VGPRIYFVALLGFVAFYGLDVMFQPPKHAHPPSIMPSYRCSSFTMGC
jgi:hypothetical protein